MMSRQPRRASGIKALEAITSNRSKAAQIKSENDDTEGPSVPAAGRLKRLCSPSTKMPQRKRSVLTNLTNNQPLAKQNSRLKSSKPTGKPTRRTATKNPGVKPKATTVVLSAPLPLEEEKENTLAGIARAPELAKPPARKVSISGLDPVPSVMEETPVTAVKNCLQAATLCDVEEEMNLPPEQPSVSAVTKWKDIDEAEAKDPAFSSQYAPNIYAYMREREVHFRMPAYMALQNDINPSMRTILVDWLIEVQENFELFHETLYLAVKLTDRYLSRKDVKREYLQLVGATSMLIAAKFEELSPPLVDDFLYLCDDAYTHDEMLKMEREILLTLDYDINIPVAYRFLRRLARAAQASMETHTLARYISESTLQDYSFVTEYPSLVAAAAMYLALRMKKLGPWTPTLVHYSGYTLEELLPLVKRMNQLVQEALKQAACEQAGQKCATSTVRSKYSHQVFFKVALVPALEDVEEDAELAISDGLLQNQ